MLEPLAIVGAGCRLPGGVGSLSDFWRQLRDGVDAIGAVPPSRWDARKFQDPDPRVPGRIRDPRGGFLTEDIWAFDPLFFGISPRVALNLDPQQRLLLEVTWEAFEDGGLIPERYAGSNVGVYMGGFTVDNLLLMMTPRYRDSICEYTGTSGTLGMLANRVSHVFDFRGPSITIDTACSSSLVAFHYACQDLWAGRCTLAVVGGVNVMLVPETPIAMSKGGFLAPDSRSKAFDARANGYGRGEGAGVAILKRLDQAVIDGDRIYALVRATGVNQDGRTAGITAPNLDAQISLLREVYQQAGVSPADVAYVEAHGTGTAIGDAVEASALGTVIGAGRTAANRCLIGSAKTNVGHLEAAAGVVGVIKAMLSLTHREVPPLANLETLNPKIPFEELGLQPATATTPLPNGQIMPLAAVNSFGFGGTNAHALLQAHAGNGTGSAAARQRSRKTMHFLPISSHSAEALAANVGRYRDWLSSPREELATIADLCRMAAVRRTHHRHRFLAAGRSREELIEQLDSWQAGRVAPLAVAGRAAQDTGRRVCFVYTGMGPQEWGMGHQLYESEPAFRRGAQAADSAFAQAAGWSAFDAVKKSGGRERVPNWIAQPANFVFQVGLSTLWRSWGVEPAALVGHSVGEIAAAYEAGALDLEDAARLCFHRSDLQQRRAGTGVMLAVGLSEKDAADRLVGVANVNVAAINSPSSVTLAGREADLDRLAALLSAENVFCRRLDVEVPYHSFEMDPIERELRDALAGLRPRSPSFPLYSTVTGSRVKDESLDGDYWWRNVRQPVKFAHAIQAVAESAIDIFLEVGPRAVLVGAIKQQFAARGGSGASVVSLDRRKGEVEAAGAAFGRLYVEGATIDWTQQHLQAGRFVSLPKYAWQRTRLCWEPSSSDGNERHATRGNVLLGRRLDLPNPTWQAEISEGYAPYLRDHRLRGSTVFPGAAFVDMALSAAAALGDEPVRVVENISLQRPLILPEHGKVLVRTEVDAGDGTIRIQSRAVAGSADAWKLNAAGRVSRSNRLATASFDIDRALARCPRTVSAERIAEEMAHRGMQYGPAFRTIERVQLGAGELVAELVLPPELDPAADHCLLHPAMLDGAFQSLIVAAHQGQQGKSLFLPSRIQRVAAKAVAARRLWAYARIADHGSRRVRADLLLIDADGTVSVEVTGLVCQTSSLAARNDPARPEELLYHEAWIEAPLPHPAEIHGGDWLIMGSDTDVCERLAASLRGKGVAAHILGPSHRKHTNGAASASLLAGRRWDRIAMCFPRLGASPEAGDPVEEALRQCQDLLSAVAASRGRDRMSRITLVTAGAFDLDQIRCDNFASEAVWGLARSLAIETPDGQFHRVDLSPAASDGEIRALANELCSDSGEEEVALRRELRYVRRIERTPASPDAVPKLVVDNSYPYAVDIRQPGRLSSLGFVSVERRAPGPNEVELQILATSLNFKDLLKIMGSLPDSIVEGTYFGDALGMEAAARVVRVGEKVSRYKAGDELMCASPQGCYRSFMTVDADELLCLPMIPGISRSALTGATIVFVTAYYAMCDLGRVQPGETVLIHSAAGGVGHAAMDIAKWLGARVLATAGSEAKRAYLRSLGAEAVMDSRSLDFVPQVREATGGRGVDFILNSLSGESFGRGVALLAPFGRFVEIGKRDIAENQRLELFTFNENLSFHSLDTDRMLAQRPTLFRRLWREVWDFFRDGKLTPPPVTEYPIRQLAEACQAMRSPEHLGKIILNLDKVEVTVEDADSQGPLFSDGTCLVTGGLSGFGAETAKWLVARGARHLLLVGRRGTKTSGADVLAGQLRSMGAQVVAAAADVANASQLSELLGSLGRHGLPPLRAVFHAAAVLDDCAASELDAERLSRVMAPKARGAWNLHQLTRAMPLDCFVMFSSLSGLLGNAGQANYSAANAFLDGLARHRAAQGLPALSVNWGAIDDVGMAVAEPGRKEQLQSRGVRLLPAQRALDVLEKCLRSGVRRSNVAIMDVDWDRLARVLSGSASRLASLAGQAGRDDAKGDVKALLADLTGPERLDLVAGLIGDAVSEILGIEQNTVALDAPLNDHGLDPLMLTELQLGVRAGLGALVTDIEINGTDSVRGLARRILAGVAVCDGDDEDAAASDVDALSEEEVDEMLAMMSQRHAAQ